MTSILEFEKELDISLTNCEEEKIKRCIQNFGKLDKRTIVRVLAKSFLDHQKTKSSNSLKDFMLKEAKTLIPDATTGKNFRSNQEKKANLPRRKMLSDKDSVDDIIEKLSRKKDSLGDYSIASELWPELSSELDKAGADPKEVLDSRNPRKTKYVYSVANDEERAITLGTFENKISAYRKKVSR